MSALQAFGSLVVGALGAAIGWIALAFVGTPIRRFFDLRGEVVRRLTEFANVRARWKEMRDDVGVTSGEIQSFELSDKEIARLEDAQKVLRDLASQMRAFAENETLAMWIVRLLRYDPKNASAGLTGLSNCYGTYGSSKNTQRKTIETALRIKP